MWTPVALSRSSRHHAKPRVPTARIGAPVVGVSDGSTGCSSCRLATLLRWCDPSELPSLTATLTARDPPPLLGFPDDGSLAAAGPARGDLERGRQAMAQNLNGWTESIGKSRQRRVSARSGRAAKHAVHFLVHRLEPADSLERLAVSHDDFPV